MTSLTVLSICTFILLLLHPADGELFSSMAGLESIFHSHQTVTDTLRRYIADEEKRLDLLRGMSANGISDFAATLRRLVSARPFFSTQNTTTSPPSHGMNPVGVFKAVKAFTVDHRSAVALIQSNSAEEHLRSLYDSSKMGIASNMDLLGAAQAIVRLQDTYNLRTADIANGRTHSSHVPMNVDDCFEIAQQMFIQQDYYHALQWLLEVESRMTDDIDETTLTFNRTVLYDYLTYSMHVQGNVEWAVFYARDMVKIDPTYPTASYLSIYEQMLTDSKSTWNGTMESLPPVKIAQHRDIEYPGYEELCRGETTVPPPNSSTLVCYYRIDSPYLRLARIKYERMYLEPEVIVIRDLLSDHETETLKALALPHLRRALVVNNDKKNSDDPENVPAGFRVAQNMWLPEYADPLVARLTKRIDLATGLDQSMSELLQIANYGVGGHYEPHYDMATENQVLDLNKAEHGNRVATLLLYLSDVAAGGATVFTELGIGVHPTKNDALFWHNVKKNGRPDMRTKHAACPVLHGQKWVANKWIHERGQEWRRSCDLNENL